MAALVGNSINVRDILDHFVGRAMNPINYLVPASGEIYEEAAYSIEGVNKWADDLDKFEGASFERDKPCPVTSNSPGLYETVQANYLQQRQKDAENTNRGWTATAGAATTAWAIVGSG